MSVSPIVRTDLHTPGGAFTSEISLEVARPSKLLASMRGSGPADKSKSSRSMRKGAQGHELGSESGITLLPTTIETNPLFSQGSSLGPSSSYELSTPSQPRLGARLQQHLDMGNSQPSYDLNTVPSRKLWADDLDY